MAVTDYDLVCIGSGPAGQRAAIQVAKLALPDRARRIARGHDRTRVDVPDVRGILGERPFARNLLGPERAITSVAPGLEQ
jgi:hypothetical protein